MSYQAGILQDSNMLANTIGSNIQKITQLTGEIQRSVNNLGSALDTPELREQLQQKKQQVHQLVKVTDRYIKDFSSLPVTTEQRQRKLQKDRLVNDFSNALAAFQRTQRQAAQKEKEFVARVRASSRISAGSEDVGYGNPFQSESQYQSQSQSQSQDVSITVEDLQIIQERESSIRQLESDIIDINDIFKDLAMMVHEQGDMIDSIEANVESADVSVQSATQQLAQAANYQSKSRKKICILLVVLVVLAVVVGLIIWASVQS